MPPVAYCTPSPPAVAAFARELLAPTKMPTSSSQSPVPWCSKPLPISAGAPKLSPLFTEVQMNVRSVMLPAPQFQQPATITTLFAAGVKTTGRPVLCAGATPAKLSAAVLLQDSPPAATRQ